jgi:hypothetical protein
MNASNQIIVDCEDSDFDFYDGCTVAVKVTANGNTRIFYVQTVNGKHRTDLGCWLFTMDSVGDIVDLDECPDFDFDAIIEAAEDYMYTKESL